jgi:hypothetical protein
MERVAGRNLSDPDNVFIAAASSELHPQALRTAIATLARRASDAPPC